MKKHRSVKASLTRVVNAGSRSHLCSFEAPAEFATPRPGQFVQVSASPELTLRRPFSVAGIPGPGCFDLLIEERGRGTRELCGSPIGSVVPVIGPLGNGFTMPTNEGSVLLVAGGIGVAGLRLLAHELCRSGRRVHALVGARSSEHLLHHLLPPPSAEGEMVLKTATDDGTEGFHGTVCELLSRELRDGPRPSAIYCCGPKGMIDSAAGIALEHSLDCQVLLEEMMACGVGACRGCVVETGAGYRSVCSDGPVFDAGELMLKEPSRA